MTNRSHGNNAPPSLFLGDVDVDRKNHSSVHPMLRLDVAQRIAAFAARDIPQTLRLATTTARYRALIFNDSPNLWSRLVSNHNSEDYAEKLTLFCLRMCIAIELATLLIQCGVSVYCTDQWGATVVHHAARYCAVRGNMDLLRFLVRKHAGAVNVRDEVGRTPLIIAANYANGSKIIAYLVQDHDGDLELRDDAGFTPLHHAALNGHLEVVRTLCTLGANIDVKSRTPEHATPLEMAVAHKRDSVIVFLRLEAERRQKLQQEQEQKKEEGEKLKLKKAEQDREGQDNKVLKKKQKQRNDSLSDAIQEALAQGAASIGPQQEQQQEDNDDDCDDVADKGEAQLQSHELESCKTQESSFW